MKATIENLESLQIDASNEQIIRFSEEIRQLKKENVRLGILNADTNAKYQELVIKYEKLEGGYKALVKISQDYLDYKSIGNGAKLEMAIMLSEDYFKAGLPTDK